MGSILDHFQQMVRHNVGSLIEPEGRDKIEHRTLVRNAAREDHVKSGYAVAGYDEQLVAKLVVVPDLPPVEQWKRQIGLKQDGHIDYSTGID